MQTMTSLGIEWLFRPRFVYTAMYRGYNINIRYSPACKEWRIYVNKNGGGSLTYKRQFCKTISDARSFGKFVVDLKEDKNETPFA